MMRTEVGESAASMAHASPRVSVEVAFEAGDVFENLSLPPQAPATEPHLDLCADAQAPPPPLPLRVTDEDRQRPVALGIHDRDREAAAAAATAVGDQKERAARRAMKRRAQQADHEQVAEALYMLPHADRDEAGKLTLSTR
jgi:hypothetical protein